MTDNDTRIRNEAERDAERDVERDADGLRRAGDAGEQRSGRDDPPADFGAVGATNPEAGAAVDREPDEVREDPAENSAEGSAEGSAEADILRDELQRLRDELEQLRGESAEWQQRYLRARADLENVRRRSAGEVQRAREAGLDSAVLTVLSVFDDLGRALDMADEDDPGKIIPGVRSVRDALERNLDSLGIHRVGSEGDAFDPDVHEALSSVPCDDPAKQHTIAQVFQAGFRRGERLVRPARVVVYTESD